ncbi:Hsp20/alpha crystallin family protein [Methanoculleus sp. 7T]|uniref:Hsp20/alpha crystallin family protein n=1 Tax=Methanoculleus sp. 7T TaxID=2937282 RepID=UPI0020C147A4|nr:Hsp20/alpha crystallin family protein [Methanoculleus sp. 7T]MCK8519261.1 Hsp20 family protein [Methanoculleus sp. 7T]
MAWRGSPRGLRAEFDELLADMQRQFNETMERISGAAQQLPLIGGAGTMIDVREHDADVVVVADLPGVERQNVSIRLLDPRTLRISARREEAREAEQAGYYMRERRIGAIARTVSLPVDVGEEGSHATFKNGVLEVRLKKTAEAGGKAIPVSGEAQKEGRPSEEPSGYLRPKEVMEEAKKVELGERGTSEEQATAERLRKHKEELYEEGKKKFAE